MSGAPGEPGRSPCVKFLSSLDSPSPHALTLLQVPDIRVWTFLGGHYSAGDIYMAGSLFPGFVELSGESHVSESTPERVFSCNFKRGLCRRTDAGSS